MAASINAVENNFLLHNNSAAKSANQTVDSDDPHQEEDERGRSAERQEQDHQSRSWSPESLPDTILRESGDALSKGLAKTYENIQAGRERFEQGDHSEDNFKLFALAHAFDGMTTGAKYLDLATFGLLSKIGQAMDDIGRQAGKYTRRGVRSVTGNQRWAQNIGDLVYLATTLCGGEFKAFQALSRARAFTKTAQTFKQASKPVNQAEKVAYARGALNLDKTATNTTTSSAKNVKDNRSRVRPINKRQPINAEYAGKVYPIEKLPKELRDKYPHSVPFTGTGHPDFSRYATKKVKIQMTGNNGIDKKLANQAVGYKNTPDGFTWHHHHDAETMLLVPTELHNAIKHTGGVAITKQNFTK